VNAETLGAALAPVNASLNLASALFLLAGYRSIRRKDVATHRRRMLGAATASGLFLILYVLRFSLTGVHEFAGPGALRPVYLAVLFSHMTLATVVVPLVLGLLTLARRKKFDAHRRLARWTFPIWLYVSATGLVVYAMLYHL